MVRVTGREALPAAEFPELLHAAPRQRVPVAQKPLPFGVDGDAFVQPSKHAELPSKSNTRSRAFGLGTQGCLSAMPTEISDGEVSYHFVLRRINKLRCNSRIAVRSIKSLICWMPGFRYAMDGKRDGIHVCHGIGVVVVPSHVKNDLT
jgi:hypothetical protein